MKTLSTLALAATFLVAAVASAQNYAIDWFTIDGGGGTSTAAGYSLSGSIGQHDAGTLSGGNYSLAGGFWGVIQTPGAPQLAIRRDPDTGVLTVSWDAPATGFIVERSAGFSGSASPSWTEIGFPYQTNAGKISITESSPSGNRFYRLRKP